MVLYYNGFGALFQSQMEFQLMPPAPHQHLEGTAAISSVKQSRQRMNTTNTLYTQKYFCAYPVKTNFWNTFAGEVTQGETKSLSLKH